MHERIDAYLTSLHGLLRKPLRDEIASQRVAEIRAHIELSIRDLRASGMSEEAVELEALRKLGSPKVIAEGLVRQHRGYGRKSTWALAVSLFGFFIVVYVAVFFLAAVPEMSLTTYAISKWSWVPFFTLYALLVWRTRRWLVLPVSIFCLVAVLVPAALIKMFSPPVAGYEGTFAYWAPETDYRLKDHVSDTLVFWDERLALSKAAYKKAMAGEHVGLNGNHAFVPVANDVRAMAWMPGAIYPAEKKLFSTAWVDEFWVASQADADQRWRDHGAQAISTLERGIADLEKYRGEPHLVSIGYGFWSGIWLSVLTVLINACCLAGLNWLVLRLGDWRKRTSNRRDPLLA